MSHQGNQRKYFSLPTEKLLLSKELTFDLYIKFDSVAEAKPQYALFCERGKVFDFHKRKKLQEKGILRVYFQGRDQEQVRQYLNFAPVELREDMDPLPQTPPKLIIQKDNWQVSRITSNLWGKGSYIPLALENLQPGWEVPADVFLKAKVQGQKNEQYFICCQEGEVFNAPWLDKLREKDITHFYIHKKDQDSFLNYLNHNLSIILAEENIQPEEKAKRVLDLTFLWAFNFFNADQSRMGPHINLGLECVENLFEFIEVDKYHKSWLVNLRRHDGTLFTHSLNVCLLSLSFGKHLNWSPGKIKNFALGALLHDIGMMNIPSSITHKPDRLSEAEMEMVKKHPLIGFRLLKSFAPITRDTLIMIMQHHEHGNGSGYPEGLNLAKIHLWARVLRILDSYEALTSWRSWRPAYDPVKALWVMRHEWQDSGIFDTNLLAEFFKFLSAD